MNYINENHQLLTEENDDGLDSFQMEKTYYSNPTTSSFQIIDNLDNFSQLNHVWQLLGANLNSPMQAFTWAWICAETVCADDKLKIAIRYREKQAVAIAPLIQQKGIFSPLQMLGVGKLYEPLDFLYTDVSAINLLFEELKKLGVAIVLDRIPLDSPTVIALHNVYQEDAWIVTRPNGSCPYILLNQNWTEPEKQFNAGRRSDFRRAQRKAEKMGQVSYEILSPTPDLVEPLLDEAFQVEAHSWKGEEGSALSLDNMRGDFYRKYAVAASQQGILRLCFLRINGQAVAMQIAIEYASRFWLLKIGYNANIAQCSPGHLLMLHTLKYAATRNLKSYEFLGDSATWTKVWTEEERPCVQIRVYPHSINGAATLGANAIKTFWKQLKTKQ